MDNIGGRLRKRDLKIIAASFTVVGVILSVLDKIYAPHRLLLESSPNYPEFLRYLGWLFLIVPPLIYIGLDWHNLFPRKKDMNQ